MKRLFRELVLGYVGRPAFIFGGGFSGYDQLPEIESRHPNPVLISANLHGQRIASCDYIVYVDDDVKLEYDTLGLKVPTITYHHCADFRLIEYPLLTNSGQYAVWVAANMGCYPIIVFGMDCYTQGTYFHDKDAFSTGNRLRLEEHLNHWRQARKKVPDSIPVRFAGGPVPPIFPAYNPEEVYGSIDFPDRFYAQERHSGKLVTIIRKPIKVEGEVFDVGQKVELNKRSAQDLISRRRAVAASVS
jgi:hypothetical protein